MSYRNILTNCPSDARNPLRVICHADLDAGFFPPSSHSHFLTLSQFERKRLNLPIDAPIVVQQWNGLIAISYPARNAGVSRHENIFEAKKKCPNLIPVHVATYKEGVEEPGYWDDPPTQATHKVSLDPYRREGSKVLKFMHDYFPNSEIEKASIDEQYIDLTEMVRGKIIERYPFIAHLPPDKTLDDALPYPPIISFAGLGNLVSTREEEDDDKREHCYTDTDTQPSWSDVALQIGAEAVSGMRRAMYEQLSYTCSAGISHNKILAKICSAWKKPDAQTILRQTAVNNFLAPMRFQKIRSLGGKFGETLAAHYDAASVSDLLTVPLSEMQRHFGEESIWIYNTIRGVNSDQVTQRVMTKSMLASKSFRPTVKTVGEIRHWFKILSSELSQRLKEMRGEQDKRTMWPKSIVLSINQLYQPSRSHQSPFPYNAAFGPELIQKHAEKLLREFVASEMKDIPNEHRLGYEVNKLALSFSGLAAVEAGQRGIAGFLGSNSGNSGNSGESGERRDKVVKHKEAKRQRTDSTAAAPSQKKKKKDQPKTGLTAFLASASASANASASATTKKQGKEMTTETITISSSEEENDTDVCPKCKIPVKSTDKGQHSDLHFAFSERIWQMNNCKLIINLILTPSCTTSMRIALKDGLRKLFKRDASAKDARKPRQSQPSNNNSVESFKEHPIGQPTLTDSSSSPKMSVKDFKRRSSSELLGRQTPTQTTSHFQPSRQSPAPVPAFKTHRKPPPKQQNLSAWHTSDEDDDDDDRGDMTNFRDRIRQSRSTIRHAATTIPDDTSDDSDDTLPLSQLRSKSQVSLATSIASKPNKSTPSLKLQGSSHQLSYRKPPPPSRKHTSTLSSTLSPASLSPNYQRQSHASYSPQSRQTPSNGLRPPPPPSPSVSMHSAPGGSLFNPFMPSASPMQMSQIPPASFPFPPMGQTGQAPIPPPNMNMAIPTPPPSAQSSTSGDLNQHAAQAAQMHFQAMMNARQSFQAYVAQHAAFLAGQQWDEEHSQAGGSEAGGYSVHDEDYYLSGGGGDIGGGMKSMKSAPSHGKNKAKSDYGGVSPSPSSADSRKSATANHLQIQQAHARAQMRYSDRPRKTPSRDSLRMGATSPASYANHSHHSQSTHTLRPPSRDSLLSPSRDNVGPPPPPTIRHYRGQSSSSSIPKNPTKLRSQSTLSMR
ncbi:hypothetical protein E3P94_02494 [Wallemia ichthyophaga]|nr:hypothetical protein E3P95_02319 [Wallemia ichthyophaga]TIA99689.1 hypothetical protein E3P94_02494 [Wallemia ichthyophaga]